MGVKARLFLMMVLQLAVWGAWAPKLFPYMGMLGFAPWQQSLVGSSWGVAALLGIFFSNQFADRNFAAERFMAASHLLSGLALLFTAFQAEFWPFFAGYLVYSLLYVPTLSVANSVAFANLAEPARDFGAIRMGGTVGWMLVSWPFVFLLGAGAEPQQVRSIFIVAAVVSFALAAYSLTLPHTPPKRGGEAADPLAWREAFRLLRVPFVAVLFVVTFVDSVIHNGYFVMADAFLTQRVGIAGNLSMVVLSLGQLAEIVTMFILGGVLIRIGWKATLIVGVLGHAARFAVFAFFPDSVPVIVAVQLLHGICYAFFFATVYIFVDAAFPEDVRSSAQGLFNLLILGVGSVVASFLFPHLMGRLTTATAAGPQVDYQTLFLVPTGMALVAVLLLALFFRPPQKGPAGPVTP
ncbi:putative membrane protein [Phenylobacterium zucineum HLK1]|uniref:Putative membrane protein n=1 Tax=Phenylobacterium zucineum (strain HLK1) TaxID=450851 RepID=B4REP2_PHEZH|nr:MFS transporter [Phenylobacterium zucineum]ACG78568.1 putative membrane protein [Phenylobacterium zucineum HLK1]